MTRRIYGEWAGKESGTEEDVSRCIETVWPKGKWIDSQCKFKRGHGKDGLYCKRHAKQKVNP